MDAPNLSSVVVTGTTANPSIRASVASMLKEQAGGALKSNGNVKSGIVRVIYELISNY